MRENNIVNETSFMILEILKDALLNYKDIIQNRVISSYDEDTEEYDYVFHGSEPDNLLELESIEDIIIEKYDVAIQLVLHSMAEEIEHNYE